MSKPLRVVKSTIDPVKGLTFFHYCYSFIQQFAIVFAFIVEAVQYVIYYLNYLSDSCLGLLEVNPRNHYTSQWQGNVFYKD